VFDFWCYSSSLVINSYPKLLPVKIEGHEWLKFNWDLAIFITGKIGFESMGMGKEFEQK